MVLALPVKNHCCRFIADGARRAGSNNSSHRLVGYHWSFTPIVVFTLEKDEG